MNCFFPCNVTTFAISGTVISCCLLKEQEAAEAYLKLSFNIFFKLHWNRLKVSDINISVTLFWDASVIAPQMCSSPHLYNQSLLALFSQLFPITQHSFPLLPWSFCDGSHCSPPEIVWSAGELWSTSRNLKAELCFGFIGALLFPPTPVNSLSFGYLPLTLKYVGSWFSPHFGEEIARLKQRREKKRIDLYQKRATPFLSRCMVLTRNCWLVLFLHSCCLSRWVPLAVCF